MDQLNRVHGGLPYAGLAPRPARRQRGPRGAPLRRHPPVEPGRSDVCVEEPVPVAPWGCLPGGGHAQRASDASGWRLTAPARATFAAARVASLDHAG